MPAMLVTVPRVLRERLGDEGSDALVALINEASNGTRTDVIAIVEERFGRLLAEELAKLRQEMAERFAEQDAKMAALETRVMARLAEQEVRMANGLAESEARTIRGFAELETKMTNRFAELETKMAALRADVIKWMFLFWVGQLTVMTGLFLAFFRH